MIARLRLRDDRGATMMELIVGMTIMLVFLSIFTGSMMLMSKSETKARSTNDTSTQINFAFLWLDKNVRYSAAISPPGKGSGTGDWYVELRDTTSGAEVCRQVRLDVGTQQLQWRTWNVSGAGYTGLTGWTPIASGFATTTQPFTRPTPTGSQAYQQLRISLSNSSGTGSSAATAQALFTFTAINSSLPAPTTAICQEAGRP